MDSLNLRFDIVEGPSRELINGSERIFLGFITNIAQNDMKDL